MTPLIVFLIAFSHRVLSGWQSMYLYRAKNDNTIQWHIILTTFAMAVSAILVTHVYDDQNRFLSFLNALIAGLMVAAVLMKLCSFLIEDKDNKWFDIHLWESAVTGSFWLYLAITGHDLIALCCSVYPALIIHKGLINKGNGLKFFDERTDDATGKTYAIPVLNIKVPRSSLKMRLLLAVLSLGVFITCYIFGVTFSI